MIQAHITVNDGTIAFITIHNLGLVEGTTLKGKFIYQWEIYEPEKEIKRGQVVHNPADGWAKLIELVLADSTKDES